MKKCLFVLILVAFMGCATNKDVGSSFWYQNRITEIEASYAKNEITRAEYLRLKNEVDSIRATYQEGRTPRTGIGFNYGVWR
jgi:hypothetical protein